MNLQGIKPGSLTSVKTIILEGISGAGKTTLMHPVSRMSNQRDPIMHRFTPSCWVYNELYHRPHVNYEPINAALEFVSEVHVVWLKIDPKLARDRQRMKEDPLTEDLEAAQNLFSYYFEKVTCLRRIHIIDTTDDEVTQTLAKIRQAIYG